MDIDYKYLAAAVHDELDDKYHELYYNSLEKYNLDENVANAINDATAVTKDYFEEFAARLLQRVLE